MNRQGSIRIRLDSTRRLNRTECEGRRDSIGLSANDSYWWWTGRWGGYHPRSRFM